MKILFSCGVVKLSDVERAALHPAVNSSLLGDVDQPFVHEFVLFGQRGLFLVLVVGE